MNCLNCNQFSWVLHEQMLYPEVNNQVISIPMLLFKCTCCGQTSANAEMMDTFIEKCLKEVKKSNQTWPVEVIKLVEYPSNTTFYFHSKFEE